MSIRIGYLLPTRERIMAGQPQAAPLLELAERAERLGFDSVWASASDAVSSVVGTAMPNAPSPAREAALAAASPSRLLKI